MSVTIEDILKLPCLSEARVVAGKNCLQKVLSSVSVLEFSNPNSLQDELFRKNEFCGSEIVITAFAGIADNVEQQCANIRRLAMVGEAGLILYYVGILMPRVDQRLIDLADQLDFTLIVMPENRMDLRYSEVIYEVMEAIIRDQTVENTLVTDVLDRMCRLPEHQRTVDAALRMTRDMIRTSLILVDGQNRALGQANWPMSLELLHEDLPAAQKMKPLQLPNNRTLWRCPLEPESSRGMELLLVKDGNPLSHELVAQVVELIRLVVSLWSQNHAEVHASELVRAILRDEPLKMRRLGALFHIDVASMHAMWVLRPKKEWNGRGEEALHLMRELLRHRCKAVIADRYEGYAVAFMAWKNHEENVFLLGSVLMEQLGAAGIDAVLTQCGSLRDTAEVRRAFLLNHDCLEDAQRIWPERQWFTIEEVDFAHQCRVVLDEGEDTLAKAMHPFRVMSEHGEWEELQRTLEIYLLDAESSVTRCAERMCLHKNTVKYRLGRVAACLGYPVDKEPEKYALYRAAALDRLLAPQ